MADIFFIQGLWFASFLSIIKETKIDEKALRNRSVCSILHAKYILVLFYPNVWTFLLEVLHKNGANGGANSNFLILINSWYSLKMCNFNITCVLSHFSVFNHDNRKQNWIPIVYTFFFRYHPLLINSSYRMAILSHADQFHYSTLLGRRQFYLVCLWFYIPGKTIVAIYCYGEKYRYILTHSNAYIYLYCQINMVSSFQINAPFVFLFYHNSQVVL